MKLYNTPIHLCRLAVAVPRPQSSVSRLVVGAPLPDAQNGGPAVDLQSKLSELQKYSACDVGSRKLHVGAFIDFTLPGLRRAAEAPKSALQANLLTRVISPISSPSPPGSTLLAKAKNGEKVIAAASTLKYVDKANKIDPLPADSPNAIPKGSHWADETEPGTVLVIEQPEGQTNAAIGGIMAMRMQMRGLVGCCSWRAGEGPGGARGCRTACESTITTVDGISSAPIMQRTNDRRSIDQMLCQSRLLRRRVEVAIPSHPRLLPHFLDLTRSILSLLQLY